MNIEAFSVFCYVRDRHLYMYVSVNICNALCNIRKEKKYNFPQQYRQKNYFIILVLLVIEKRVTNSPFPNTKHSIFLIMWKI